MLEVFGYIIILIISSSSSSSSSRVGVAVVVVVSLLFEWQDYTRKSKVKFSVL